MNHLAMNACGEHLMISICTRLMMMDSSTDYIDQFKLLEITLIEAIYNNTLWIFFGLFLFFFHYRLNLLEYHEWNF